MVSTQILTFVMTTILGVFLLPAANGLKCYQCNSTDLKNPFQCNEFLPDDHTLEPESCDHIDNARYCVKIVGRAEGTIKCYQCDSTYNLNCTDMLIHDSLLEPQECSHLAEAAYCVKAFGRYAGTLGTIRKCSTSDVGNQCMEVKQNGDELRYRSCMYTCDTDGCNSASSATLTSYLLMLSGALVFVLS